MPRHCSLCVTSPPHRATSAPGNVCRGGLFCFKLCRLVTVLSVQEWHGSLVSMYVCICTCTMT
jgi:hypothetical protein